MKKYGFNFNTTYTTLPEEFYTVLKPNSVPSPEMIILNDTLAESLGLDFSNLSKKQQAELFSGNQLPKESTPFSQAYAGHQFGHFTILGDGRAHIWGEHLTPDGARFDIQFKGSGRTPYSRRGDGKAVLGPMLREYIISEAMYNLGIPTTRSLAVVTTGELVRRESMLPGAILTRVASSHIRVGTFEFAASQQNIKLLEDLMNYTIQRHYPELAESPNTAIDLIKTVMEKQADLIVHWMRVGFIHGVMNTDNMTLSGETIDYGPCAFMDAYDPDTVFSSIDKAGRYSYANQPQIAQWNLARLAEALLPLIDTQQDKAIYLAEETINQFPEIYQSKLLKMMRDKLGLLSKERGDDQLISDLLNWMYQNKADYTNTFLDLSQTTIPTGKVYEQKPFQEWYQRWQSRLNKNQEALQSALDVMRHTNPAVIPRNHKVEEALMTATQGNLDFTQDLLKALKEPYVNKRSLKPFQIPTESGDSIYQTYCGT